MNNADWSTMRLFIEDKLDYWEKLLKACAKNQSADELMKLVNRLINDIYHSTSASDVLISQLALYGLLSVAMKMTKDDDKCSDEEYNENRTDRN